MMKKIAPKGEFGRRVYLTQKEIEIVLNSLSYYPVDLSNGVEAGDKSILDTLERKKKEIRKLEFKI